jgi:hypothetical protein
MLLINLSASILPGVSTHFCGLYYWCRKHTTSVPREQLEKICLTPFICIQESTTQPPIVLVKKSKSIRTYGVESRSRGANGEWGPIGKEGNKTGNEFTQERSV